MVGDPNWLYSTIAQASVAIVAIVGGFITATMLMLTAEKRSLSHQLTDKETRLEFLKHEEKKLFAAYRKLRVDEFLNAIADDLKKEDELPPLEVLIQRYPGWNLNHKILKREYEKLAEKMLEARNFIEQHSDKIDLAELVLFDEWVKENNLDTSSYDPTLLGQEYYRFRNRKKETPEEEKRTPWLPQVINWNITPSPPITAQYRVYQWEREDRILDDTRRRLSDIRHEIFLLESEVINLDSRLKAFSYPPNLKWGIAVLGYLAVSIFVPVRVIAGEAYSASTKQLVIGLFFSGLSAIFVYMVYQIYTLRRRSSNATG